MTPVTLKDQFGNALSGRAVTLTGSPTGGSFTLTFGGDTTSGIAYNASASTVRAL